MRRIQFQDVRAFWAAANEMSLTNVFLPLCTAAVPISLLSQSSLNSQSIAWRRHSSSFREARGVGGFRPCPVAAFGLPEVCTRSFPFQGDGSDTSPATQYKGAECLLYSCREIQVCSIIVKSAFHPLAISQKRNRINSVSFSCCQVWLVSGNERSRAESRLVEMRIMKRSVRST